MTEPKGWDWEHAPEEVWREPSEESYYFLNRWLKQGYKKFLDIGCGIGRHSLLFAQNGFEVSSIDISKSGIEELEQSAKCQGLNIKAEIADMTKLPFSDSQFDCAFAFHTIYHTDSSGIKLAISEIHRVLKPGGELLVTFNSKNSSAYKNPINKVIDNNTIVKVEGFEANIPHYYADLEDIEILLSEFRIIRIRHIEDILGISNSSWHYFVHVQKKY